MALPQKFRSLSKNHFIVLLLCAVIGYLLRSHDTYELRPVWRKRAEYHHFNNKNYPTKSEQLPAPLITDLDSDGINEIVLITNDLKLSVMTLPDGEKHDEEDRTLPHVEVKHKVVLPMSQANGTKVDWPIVMVAGFTTPYRSMMQIRHQVIVIVTESWKVYCYSADLDLMWTKQMMDLNGQLVNYQVKAMGALVTSESVKKSDEGLVIVGASYRHTAHQTEAVIADNETHPDHTTEEESFSHFSTFALSAKDGTTRWHHLPGEFGEKDTRKEEINEHHWKLGLKRHRLHIGESPWTYYKKEIYKALPHLWRNVGDTKFTLGRYQKVLDEAVFSDDTDTNYAASTTKSALDAKHIIGYAYGGQRPHSDIEHIVNPNAVVINHHRGVEVLNLLTGQPITRLPLPDDGAIYATMDVDNDIKKLSWGEQQNFSPCFLEIWRLFPIKENLERFAVCLTKRLFFTNNWVYDEDMFIKLPPLIIKSIARKTGVVRHLLGHHLRKDVTDQYDFIALGSMGRITSIDKNGDFNWQSQIGATWDGVGMTVRRLKKGETSLLAEEFHQSFQPDRKLMSLQLYGEQNNLVMVGWNQISLMELTEGRVLAEHSTPCPSTGPLVVGDFNNDGFNDVIFTCKFGYIGFSLHRKSNHTFTILYGVAVFLTILVMAWILSPERQPKELSDDEAESS